MRTAFNLEMGEYSYTPELAAFAVKNQEVVVLESELKEFKGILGM